ncbi:hypothetical protein HFV04_021395 [Pseudomonas sp. BIGb0427]|uniref:hypothetical protein n=1 Tax=unclassified Pseudomonas TaxID=196821 RepID=UPI0016BA9CC9|nr:MULTISPECIES: hypothetical protein [unclassified Pseudomonas]NLU60422.1 hypothetical protein [Pseudomonas sp. BIGb0427]QPG62060.1 hypothetical protein HFV04_021395 [Pseudomonas sp. BIGb0427]UVM64415.1 hypothetical protein LOY34_13745 [Pseudomonas sp. B21-009]
MSKLVEITHFRTEQFTLTKDELVEALKKKYGNEPIFTEGQIDMVAHQQLFQPADETQIYFRIDLTEQ